MGEPVGVASTMRTLARHKVVPVIRYGSVADATKAIDTLRRAGFKTFEITLSVPDAYELIGEYADRDTLIGVGTVFTVEEAKRSIEAGARYVVSPVLVPDLAALCREADVACISSGFTPTEVWRAWQGGAAAVKVFPAASAGGPAHIKALKSVLPDVPLIPTGGVNQTNLDAYFAAGAECVGVGSALLPPEESAWDARKDLMGHLAPYLAHIDTTYSRKEQA